MSEIDVRNAGAIAAASFETFATTPPPTMLCLEISFVRYHSILTLNTYKGAANGIAVNALARAVALPADVNVRGMIHEVDNPLVPATWKLE